MTKDEALKMAIEFISKNKDAINGFNEIKEMNEAIQACKEALMQDAKAKELIELYNCMADEVWGRATGQIKGKNNG